MYVYACIMYVHLSVCMYVFMYNYYNYVCRYMCMRVHYYDCMIVCMYACKMICMYVFVYICMYIHIYVCMCMHVFYLKYII